MTMHDFYYYFLLLIYLGKDRLMPPSFVLPKRSIVEVEYGKSINLTCQANGLPKPRVRWIEGAVTCFISLFNFHI